MTRGLDKKEKDGELSKVPEGLHDRNDRNLARWRSTGTIE